jgi:hypothetical protein
LLTITNQVQLSENWGVKNIKKAAANFWQPLFGL